MGRTRTRKKGSMNVAGTKKWDGTKWVPVNVARDGQRATLNGKPVVRKNGQWVPVKASTRTTNRRSSSGNKPTPTKTTPKPVLKDIPASKRPADMQAGKVYGDAGQPPAPTLPPKPTPTKPTPTKPTPTKTTPRTTTRTPQKQGAGGMDANYKAWAKANPTLAKKVKKGQAGYKAINSSSRAAKPSDAQNLRSGPTPPKRTSLKTTPPKTKPTKPLAVPTNQIPKNLNSPAGRKYIADLDAGKLTRKRK